MAKKPVLDVKGLDETQKAALYAKIGEWQKAKSKAAEWTAKEMDLRKEIVAEFFPADCEEGKNNMKLEWGKQLGFTRVINRSVEKVQLKAALELEAAKKAADPTYKSNILPIIDEVIQVVDRHHRPTLAMIAARLAAIVAFAFLVYCIATVGMVE
jgi:hypothetical protein